MNILLVTADQWRAQHLDQTLALTELTSGGVVRRHR
jgi:hypothetical protein